MGGWSVVTENPSVTPSGWTPVAAAAPAQVPTVISGDFQTTKGGPVIHPPIGHAATITPEEGESFGDTIQRAIDQSKQMTPSEGDAYMKQFWKNAPKDVAKSLIGAAVAGPAVIGAATAPEAASGAVTTALGSGAAGSTAAGAAGGAAGGASLELLNKGLHAAAGDNVLTAKDAEDVASAGGWGALIGGVGGLAGGWLSKLLSSKLARGMVNESVGASARDVTYGNPAKALMDENITSPITGDIEKYKTALRAGASPADAMQAAGGRTAAVSQKINELAPTIDKALANSKAAIPVADAIDKPLLQFTDSIIKNPAMTQAEKDAAVGQIGAFQQSLKEGLGDTITPLQANQIKQAIGNRINWAGNVAVTDEVKPAYRAVYSSLKNAVNGAVPEVAQTNERLTNLLAAQTDLEKLMKAEEVGQGKGALGSAVTGIARRAEAVAGRAVPGIASGTKAVRAISPLLSGMAGEATSQASRSDVPDLTSPITGGALASPDDLFKRATQ